MEQAAPRDTNQNPAEVRHTSNLRWLFAKYPRCTVYGTALAAIAVAGTAVCVSSSSQEQGTESSVTTATDYTEAFAESVGMAAATIVTSAVKKSYPNLSFLKSVAISTVSAGAASLLVTGVQQLVRSQVKPNI